MIEKAHRFYVVGSALIGNPRDVDIYCVVSDRMFEYMFDLTPRAFSFFLDSSLESSPPFVKWKDYNISGTRILQSIFPELIPIDFKYLPQSMLLKPNKKIDITTRPDTWGISFPNNTRRKKQGEKR